MWNQGRNQERQFPRNLSTVRFTEKFSSVQGTEPPNLNKNRNDISMLIEFFLRNVRSSQVTPKLNISAATITAMHSHSTKAGGCVSPTVACDSGDHRLTSPGLDDR